MTTITIAKPLKVEAPRGARMAALLALRLLSAAEAGWLALAERRRQSARESEANNLRRVALQYEQADPRVAAEMLSAADRHELTR